MTRRGSIVYYMAAWACGCLFMSLAVWLSGKWEPTHWTPGFKGASGFLAFYFLSLILGAFTALLFAFLLRRSVAVLGWRQPWQWIAVGAVLAPLTIWVSGLAEVSRTSQVELGRWVVTLLLLFFAAPALVREKGLWLAVPVGAATALVLYHIHRAFEPRPDTPRQ